MQSPGAETAVVVRPKVGRLPALPPVAKVKQSRNFRFTTNERWDARFITYAASLIAVLAIITGLLVHMQTAPEEVPAPLQLAKPPALAPAAQAEIMPTQRISVNTPQEKLVGHVARIDPPDSASAYTVQQQTVFDKEDRKRLLSIISNH